MTPTIRASAEVKCALKSLATGPMFTFSNSAAFGIEMLVEFSF